MTVLRLSLTVAALALAPLTALTAQERPPLTPGVRVRVTARTPGINRYDGTVVAIRGDTLVVDTVRVALMSVTQLDVYQGRKSHVLPGLVIGLVAGAVAGAIIGDLQDCGGSDISEGWCAAVGAGVGAAGGLLIGGLVGGLVWRSDRWEEVPLDDLRVSLMPIVPGGLGATVRVRWSL